ncbi:hypothetical protein GCM10027063_43690 [Promicromonospora xylanilytica]
MTTTKQSTTGPDESWVAHLRELSTGVVPPTSANPHAMSRVAIRRTRNRRAALSAGGGLLTVAAVAGAALALGGPATQGMLLPGGSPSASDTERPAAAEEPRKATPGSVPDGWTVHELEGLTYALPPEIVSSGRVQDEPGSTSDMWRSGEDPDAPPFLRVAHVTPEYEFYDSEAGGLTQEPGSEATSFDLPGSSLASVEEGTADLSAAAGINPEAEAAVTPVRILVHRADDPGRYVITMTLPKSHQTMLPQFIESLTLS